ncbi:MAG: aminotransferase class V-fold PLP-dependent enzyme [Acidobacteriota bacterium]|nr:aminotransferase class V-fold PLP-dependent enzyme [Acidobacteriota bacterium]
MDKQPLPVDRRTFLQLGGAAGAALCTSPVALASTLAAEPPAPPQLPALSPPRAATSESFWRQVRRLYAPDPSVIDFDNGNSGPAPTAVIDAYLRHARLVCAAPNVHYGLNPAEAVFTRTAALLHTTIDVLAMVPNATTGLNTILHGFPLVRGDEVIVTNHEYPDMVETLNRRAMREGLVVRTIAAPDIGDDSLALVSRFRAAVTSRTKLLLVSHVSAWNSEIFSVAELCAEARAHGVAVLVDAAQSVGYLDVDFAGWGCDFLATSMHKGMGAPIATGVLVVRKDWFGKVEPLHPPTWDTSKYPVAQYAWTGTANVAAHATLPDAIAAQERIGLARKRARLAYLAAEWHSMARDIKGFRVLTPMTADRSFGWCSFAIDHVPSKVVAERLRKEFQILVQDKASRPYRPYDNAVRVSPQPFATPAELQRFTTALRTIAR